MRMAQGIERLIEKARAIRCPDALDVAQWVLLAPARFMIQPAG